MVGLFTSATGAAVQDITKIIKSRNNYVDILVYPVLVQGPGAAPDIASAISDINRRFPETDVMIVGRGGGSMEELWAFNEEIVARAIYAAKTPIISGTGHEIDTTLADYAADRRAPTPSAACELAIPDIMTDLNRLSNIENALKLRMNNKLSLLKVRLAHYDTRINLASPVSRLAAQTQYLADLYDRMKLGMERKFESKVHNYELLVARLDGLSPTAKLVNGFGYIESDGRPVTSASSLKAGGLVKITVNDGVIDATVNAVDTDFDYAESEGNVSEGDINE